MTPTASTHLTAIVAAARAIVANSEACTALAPFAAKELTALVTHLGCLDAEAAVAEEGGADGDIDDVPTLDDRLPVAVIEQRNACAAALAAAGFTHVTMTYSGSGDEGNLNDIIAEPLSTELSDELHDMLSDFGDAFMGAVASCYEDGEGGGSDIVFDIAARTFHADVYNNEVTRSSYIDDAVDLPLGADAQTANEAALEPAE